MRRAIFIFLSLSLLLPACQKEQANHQALVGNPQNAATASNAFAVDLYHQLAATDGNLFFSPASLTTALTMAWAGADGKTAEEMAQTLHLGPERSHALPDAGSLQKDLTGGKSETTLNIANRIWLQKDFKFQKEYVHHLDHYFESSFASMDFKTKPDAERKIINQWVAKHTADKIQDLMPPGSVTSDTRLVLTNAVYFLGDWKFPFKANKTHDRDFHLADGTVTEVPTMSQRHRLPHFAGDKMAALALPYQGDETEFLIFLPHEKNGLGNLEKELTPAVVQNAIDNLVEAEVDLALPTLELTQSFALNKALANLGMKSAFNSQTADFSGISDGANLFISAVVHKAYLRVDEKGTEAAAATGITIGVTSMPPPAIPFKCDHPFLFMIRHRATGAILFMGRMENPSS